MRFRNSAMDIDIGFGIETAMCILYGNLYGHESGDIVLCEFMPGVTYRISYVKSFWGCTDFCAKY